MTQTGHIGDRNPALHRFPGPLRWLLSFVVAAQEGVGGGPHLVIWNASSPHYRRALEASKESAYGECRCERPADRAVGAEWARTGVFGEASSSSPCCPVAI